MSKEIWHALWMLQIAITCECIYQRHWACKAIGPWETAPEYNRVFANQHGVFQTQVRDRLFWDETLRGPKQAA